MVARSPSRSRDDRSRDDRSLDRPERGLSPLARSSVLIGQRLDPRRVVAVALALVIGLLVARMLLTARATTAALGQTSSLVVADTDLDPGHTITETDLRVEHHPTGLLPPGSATSTDQVVGAVVRAAMKPGEPIAMHRIGPGRLGLSPQERAVTLPRPLAPPPVAVGDEVELVGVGVVPGTELIEARLLGMGRVVHRDEQGITVAVAAPLSIALVEWLAAGAVDIVVSPQETG